MKLCTEPSLSVVNSLDDAQKWNTSIRDGVSMRRRGRDERKRSAKGSVDCGLAAVSKLSRQREGFKPRRSSRE